MTNDTSSQSGSSVKNYLASLEDERTIKDCQVLIEMMQRISGHEPKMWNVGTIGFDTYHYKYDSGREGDGHIIGFYPIKTPPTDTGDNCWIFQAWQNLPLGACSCEILNRR